MQPPVALGPERAQELCNLQTVCGMERWPSFGWVATLSSSAYAGWGFEDREGVLLAIALGSVLAHRPHTARLDLLMTRPMHRQQGLGTLLLQKWMSWAREFGGVTDLLLEVEPGNGPAIHLYAKHGFVVLPPKEGSVQPLKMTRPLFSV